MGKTGSLWIGGRQRIRAAEAEVGAAMWRRDEVRGWSLCVSDFERGTVFGCNYANGWLKMSGGGGHWGPRG